MEKNTADFEIPSDVLDEIQNNIQSIIESFNIPDDNKIEVIKKINFMYTQTKNMSITDALTKLHNRRHFETEFAKEYKRSKRYGCDISIAVVDIDFFKKINDIHGHLCGDYVLKEIAYIIKDNFRQTDLLFRYGGEEFVVILTETSEQNACIPLERLRKRIENNVFKYKGKDINVTVSIGVSSNNKFDCCELMLEDADNALYDAKKAGRNCVRSARQ